MIRTEEEVQQLIDQRVKDAMEMQAHQSEQRFRLSQPVTRAELLQALDAAINHDQSLSLALRKKWGIGP